jgi:hypothetical protein
MFPNARDLMGSDEYWVVVCRDQDVLGGGVLLTRHHVLTINLHLRGLPEHESSVDLYTASGLRLAGTILETDDNAGLMLLSVAVRPAQDLATPQMDHASKGDEWFAPYRPSQLVPHLRGTVDSIAEDSSDGAPVREAEDAGASHRLRTIQLSSDVMTDCGADYEGGPVERRTSGSAPALVGVLVPRESVEESPGSPAGSFTAGAIDSAMDGFDKLSALVLAQWLVRDVQADNAAASGSEHLAPGEAGGGALSGGVGVAERTDLLYARFDLAEESLRRIGAWERDALIDPLDATPYRVAIVGEIAEAVIEELGRREGGE